MKWINKDKGNDKADAEQVVKDYLNNCCLQDGRYQNVRYDKRDSGNGQCFCNADGGNYRRRFTNILLRNQSGYCCYCMRKLKTAQNEIDSDEVVTREHIIPRGFTVADTNKVSSYYQQCQELSVANVILTDKFEDESHNQNYDLPPFPHKVAYNNLVASCNGTFPYVRNEKGSKQKICCNEKREEKDAFPIYFIQNVEELIEYCSNGEIQARNLASNDIQAKICDVINNTSLDCNPLKDIRYLWYILSHVPKERIYGCRNESQRDALFSEILYSNEFFGPRIPNIHTCFIKDVFWETFLLYDFFYDVYHSTI